MDPTQRENIGSPPVRATRLGFGGAPIGNLTQAVPDSDARAAAEAAWDAGIRYFDTAPWYGIGLSEHRIGSFLRDKPRSEYVLSTKVGRLLKPWPPRYGPRSQRGTWTEPLDFEVRFDYSYDGIMRAWEDSLQRLGLPEVDILLIHDLDRGYHGSEAGFQARLGQLANGGFAALRDLRAEGRISAIGAGVNVPGTITEMLDLCDLDLFLVAGPYTLIEHSILNTELARCSRQGVRVVIGSALRDGLLATGVRPGDVRSPTRFDAATLDRVKRFEAACERFDVPLPAAALQFPSAHPTVASLVFGAVNADQVKQCAVWYGMDIPPELWSDLKEEGLIPSDAPIP
jgi:D-threo-aldose 1-dehydrogenase